MRVVQSPAIKSGQIYMGQPYGSNEYVVFVGSAPLTDLEAAGYHGRYLVNKGLRDVVQWLGECPLTINPANNFMAVMRHVGTAEVPFGQVMDR